MKIRNIGIIAHIDAGKTTTTERLLFHAGVIRKPGNVDSGNTTTDYLPQERERGITIKAAAISFSWKDTMINLIDTPGHVDFGGEVARTLRVMEGAVCVLDASKGVEAQTVAGWRLTEKYGVRRIIFINKIDKVGADLVKCIQSIKENLHSAPLLLQKPVSDRSLVDLVRSMEIEWDDSGNIVRKVKNTLHKRQFLENLAENSDAILEKLVNDIPIEEDVISREVEKLCKNGLVIPVLFGSSLKNYGTQPILDAICDYLPEPFINSTTGQNVFCFKFAFDDNRPLVFVKVYGRTDLEPMILYNVSKGSRPVRIHKLFQVRADELIPVDRISAGGIGVITGLDEKLVGTGDTLAAERSAAPLFPLELQKPVFMRRIDAPTREAWTQLDLWLNRLCKEDPSLEVIKDTRLGQTLLAGMGELHLDVIHRRLVDELGIEVHLGNILVKKYVSICKESTMPLNERYSVKLEPLPLADYKCVREENEYRCFPRESPDLRYGVEGALARGKNGYSCIGLKCTLVEKQVINNFTPPALTLLQVHDFVHAQILKKPLVTLEPFVKCFITMSSHFLGAVLSDLYTNRAGNLMEQQDEDAISRLQVLMPLEKSVGYATWLRELMAGNGTLEMENAGYRSTFNDELSLDSAECECN